MSLFDVEIGLFMVQFGSSRLLDVLALDIDWEYNEMMCNNSEKRETEVSQMESKCSNKALSTFVASRLSTAPRFINKHSRQC